MGKWLSIVLREITATMSSWESLKPSEINEELWNSTVAASLNETPYGYTGYLNALDVNWIACVYKDYQAVFPLRIEQKLGVTYAAQTPFLQRTSVFSINGVEPDLVELDQLITKKCKYIDFTSDALFDFSGLDKTGMRNLILPLSQSFDQLKNGFSNNLKRNISKAVKSGLETERVSPKEISHAISIFKSNKNYKLDEAWYKALENLAALPIAELYAVTKEKSALGYALLVKSNKRVTLLFTALEDEGKQLGAMPFLLSKLIEQYSPNSLIFDFEGSENENVARFYESFGAEEEHYFHYESKGLLKSIKVFIKGS